MMMQISAILGYMYKWNEVDNIYGWFSELLQYVIYVKSFPLSFTAFLIIIYT